MTLSSSARSVHATLAPGGDVRVVHRRLPRTCLTNHVLPVIVHGPSAARALMQCGGRDVACQRVGAGAVDPARAQAGAPSCCGGSSGQLPWCHYTSSCPGSHVASRPIRRVNMPSPVTTCRHHLPGGPWRSPPQRTLPAAQDGSSVSPAVPLALLPLSP